jgi:hypothetical protein
VSSGKSHIEGLSWGLVEMGKQDSIRFDHGRFTDACGGYAVARAKALDELQVSGARNGLGAAADAQFAVDVGGVRLDSAHGEHQLLRDLPIG